jgi:heme iron utilization protein
MPRDHQPPASSPAASAGDTAPAVPSGRAPTHAERCRTLIAGSRAATLCTIAREPAGFPYGSLVTVALDDAGRPLLLLSELAEHTQNLAHCADASLLLAEPLDKHRTPLALGRVTLLGSCKKVPDEDRAAARAAFLAAQPDASFYVDFKDFSFFRLEPVALRYVGGFGRMSWVNAADYLAAEPDPLVESAPGILKHMNEDHGEAMIAYARAFAGLPEATAASMTAVDRYGFELSVSTPAGPKAARLAFEEPVATSDEVRKAMVVMVKKARAALAG